MSRVRLQWKVESREVDASDSDDPKALRSRRRAILRLVLLVVAVMLILAAAAFTMRRLAVQRQADLETLLRDTVKAEVASLRIGDINTWLGIQDGRDPVWRQSQQATFRQYTDLKARGEILFTGEIQELTIAGQRALVVVEEVIRDSASTQTWLYAFHEGAWRHVAPGAENWIER